MCRTQDAARLRTKEVLLKDDLAILFAADLGPAISAVETFGASMSLCRSEVVGALPVKRLTRRHG
jgi:hypothetical protein